jgi:hypothetical protein
MVALAGMAIALWWFKPESPESRRRRETAQYHQNEAKRWESCAKLSEESVTTLAPGLLPDGRKVIILEFNHFVPRTRPQGAAAGAAFDRECASIAAKCRTMAAYHGQLRKKWETAAWYHWKAVPPDPPSPLPLEISSNLDASY